MEPKHYNYWKNNLTIQAIFVFFISIALCYWRFAPWEPTTFYADDLTNLWSYYDGNFASTLHQTFFGSYYEKYRPIFQIVCHVLFSTFDRVLWLYLAFNLLMQGINSVLFFIISVKLAKNSFYIPFFLTIAFCTSRLALYQITQVTGLVESIPLTFLLITLYAVLQSVNTTTPKFWQWMALLATNLAIYSHERYIVVVPWLALLFLFTKYKKTMSLNYRFFMVLICIATIGLNYLVKVVFLQIPFFVGTGGTHMSINMNNILLHIKEAYCSIIGFNHGPGYLIGITVPINPIKHKLNLLPTLMALIFSGSFLLVHILAVYNSIESRKRAVYFLLSGLILIALLLVPPIFTIRVEGRWEYAPFMLILLSFAWSYGLPKTISNTLIGIICILASFASIVLDTHICKYFGITNWWNGIYMIYEAKISNALLRDVVPRFIDNPLSNEIIILADKYNCDTLTSLKYFEFYANRKAILFCAKSLPDLKALQNQHPKALVFTYNNYLWTDYPYREPEFTQVSKALD